MVWDVLFFLISIYANEKKIKASKVDLLENTPPSGHYRNQSPMQSHLSNILFFSLIKNPADRADLKQLMASPFILHYTFSSRPQALTPKDLHILCLGAPFHQVVWSKGSRLRWMAVQHHWLESAGDPNPQCRRVTNSLLLQTTQLDHPSLAASPLPPAFHTTSTFLWEIAFFFYQHN